MGVVIITGARRGLGRARATHLARVGHTVVATMRDPMLGADLHGHGYIDGRRRLSDEAWIGLGRRLSDKDFFAEFTTLFAPVPA
jgi:NAD(P)-dependent dehydrogenase (short-subunit alcohol dehydrogenase family)